MIDIALSVLRVAWPFVLAGAIWAYQESRIGVLTLKLHTAQSKSATLKEERDTARQRATDIALLYANTLPKIDDAARKQKEADDAEIAKLQTRIDGLSHDPVLYLSPDAIGVLRDIAVNANAGNAPAAPEPARGAPALSDAAAPAQGGYYSEADIVEYDKLGAAAYLAAVRDFHECRNLYNAARAAQLTGATP